MIMTKSNIWAPILASAILLPFLPSCADPVLHQVSFPAAPAAQQGATTDNTEKEGVITYYTAEGGVVISNGKHICVAPPAQGARLTDVAAGARMKADVVEVVDVEGETEFKRDRDVETLYSQSQGNLLLQFAMYRLCEMYMNGALGNTEAEAESNYISLFTAILEAAKSIVSAEAEKSSSRAKEIQALTNYDELQQKILQHRIAASSGEKAPAPSKNPPSSKDE